jgi:regulator of sigma E protease
MTVFIAILSFLVIIIVLILAHEIGHFITARLTGVKVEEFGVGYPPRLWSFKKGETIYSINAIPIGGFCKMAGEEDPEVPRSLASKGIGVRLLVLSAGSLMNFLLPLLLFSIAFMVPHTMIIGQTTVVEVTPNSPASLAGIEPGDVILDINGKPVNNSGDVQRYIQLYLGNKITVLVQHNDATTETVQLTPRWRPPEGDGAVGIQVTTADAESTKQHYPFWKAIPKGVGACIETFILFKNGIFSMIIGTAPVAVTGPVGIAQLTGEVAKAGISPLLEFAAFLSINLGLVNIFPLPALDGGRIAFVILEGIRRGKRIQPKTEGIIHLIGFALLMVFFVAIAIQDIIRIVRGDSLIP